MSYSNKEKDNYAASSNTKKLETPEINLLLKVQTATKDWDKAPSELLELLKLLQRTGYDVDWTPKRLGINLLTPNKIRGMVLKRILMKLYPFEAYWITESLDETLHKCLLVCQQLTLESDRAIVWGQCSMTASYEFWKKVLQKTNALIRKSRDEEGCIQEAKSNVISALIASRGTDWDKQIARNFADSLGIGNRRFSTFIKTQKSLLALSHSKQKLIDAKLSNYNSTSQHHRPYTANQHQAEFGINERAKLATTTTTSLTSELKKESQEMNEILKSIEKYYRSDSVLQIESAFVLSKIVDELTLEFEGYMTANNRGAFKDVESLTNHTDKVIRAMSKLTTAYNDFFLEFQKYFRNAGGGDDVSISIAMSKLAEVND